MNTFSNSERVRILDLNDKAVKDAVNSAKSLQAAAAACMYMLMHGHKEFINDLYFRLAKESPKDAYALRSMYAKRVIDVFGKGGIRKLDDANVWAKRPTPFIMFSSTKPESASEIEGFKLVDVKNNDSLTDQQKMEIKQARREIREAGEQALNFEWHSQDAEKRAASAFGLKELIAQATRLLTKAAKDANVNGMTQAHLSAAGRALGLSPDDIGKVLANYNDGSLKSNGDEDEDEDDIAESGVSFVDEEKPEDEAPIVAKAKNKAKADNAPAAH